MAGKWIPVGHGRYRLVDTAATAVANREGHLFTRRDHLTPKERRALKIQLGKDFDSRSSLEAYMKQNDFRFIDNGETGDRFRKDLDKWMRDTKPGERGKVPWAKKRRWRYL